MKHCILKNCTGPRHIFNFCQADRIRHITFVQSSKSYFMARFLYFWRLASFQLDLTVRASTVRYPNWKPQVFTNDLSSLAESELEFLSPPHLKILESSSWFLGTSVFWGPWHFNSWPPSQSSISTFVFHAMRGIKFLSTPLTLSRCSRYGFLA